MLVIICCNLYANVFLLQDCHRQDPAHQVTRLVINTQILA